MGNVNLPIRLAPENLTQSILPGWQFSLFSVDLGHSSDPDMEKAVINGVGSYGKQIGHLAEALEVVITELGLLDGDRRERLPKKSRDALQVFMGDVAAARGLKGK
jgi:hypothetical protein